MAPGHLTAPGTQYRLGIIDDMDNIRKRQALDIIEQMPEIVFSALNEQVALELAHYTDIYRQQLDKEHGLTQQIDQLKELCCRIGTNPFTLPRQIRQATEAGINLEQEIREAGEAALAELGA